MQPQLLDLFSIQPTFNNFISVKNEVVYNSLYTFASQFTHISGAPLNGKTHLLKAWVNLATSQNKKAIYIATNDLIKTVNYSNLVNEYDYIAIDDIDQLKDYKQIEIFDLFNAIKLNNLPNFLLTSSQVSLEHTFNLRQDLKTRLLSGLNLNLKALNDEELLLAIETYALQEGIKITTLELNYLLTHSTRNLGQLINILHTIANIATLNHRQITIPLIKQVIEQDQSTK